MGGILTPDIIMYMWSEHWVLISDYSLSQYFLNSCSMTRYEDMQGSDVDEKNIDDQPDYCQWGEIAKNK